MPVNPESYKANYGALSAYDRPREGYAGNVIMDTLDYYQRDKEARSVQAYREQQKKQLEQNMAMKSAEQQGAIDYMNKVTGQDLNRPLRQEDASKYQKTVYDQSNVTPTIMQNYLNEQQRDVINKQAQATHQLNVGKTTKPTIIGQSYKDVDGKWKQKTTTFNPETNEYDYKTIDATDLEAVATSKGKTPDTREPFSVFKDRAVKEYMQDPKVNLTYNKENYDLVANNPAFSSSLQSKYMAENYDVSTKIGTEGKLPVVKYPNTKVGSKSYSDNQAVTNKFGKFTAFKTPDGKSSALQYSGEKVPSTLQDHIGQLEKKDQANYAKLIEEGNANFMFDKFSADKLYHLANQLSGGNPKIIQKFFESYVSSSLRAGGLGTAIATSAFVPSFDYADFDLDPNMRNSKQALTEANSNLYAWAMANGKIKVDKEGGVNEKTGMYDFVLLDEKGQPVPKEDAQERYRDLYKQNKHAISGWSPDTERPLMESTAGILDRSTKEVVGQNLWDKYLGNIGR